MIVHWVADFILQSDEDAKGKSTHMKHLVSHTAMYSILWICPLLIYSTLNHLFAPSVKGDFHKVFDFVIITFLLHTLTDYFTSRWCARLWINEKRHKFFVVIGFDQMLHYAQLYLTYYFIYKT